VYKRQERLYSILSIYRCFEEPKGIILII